MSENYNDLGADNRRLLGKAEGRKANGEGKAVRWMNSEVITDVSFRTL